jgi:hypothetical protein
MKAHHKRSFGLYVGIILAVISYKNVVPDAPPFSPSGTKLHTPPPSILYQVASMGRPEAAADLLWLQVVSFVGYQQNEVDGYIGLEYHLDRITDLAPAFELPYWLGGILLATSPGRSDAADKILVKGEKAYPNDWEFSQWRGFAAYFGEMNIDKALVHYKNAVKKPGHAPYLRSFIKRLEKSKNDCRFLAESLEQMKMRQDSTTSFLNSKTGQIIKNCLTQTIKQAAASYRLKEHNVALDIDVLFEKGYLKERPPAPKGFCWDVLGITELRPCEGVKNEKENYIKYIINGEKVPENLKAIKGEHLVPKDKQKEESK